VRVVVTAVSVDAALSLVGYYGGCGDDVDMQLLPPGDLARATLQLALLVRRCLGETDDERLAELERLSLHMQLSDLEHPEAVNAGLSLVSHVVASADDAAAVGFLVASPAPGLDLVARRLAWMAFGLLGEDDAERARTLASVSLTMQLVGLEGD